MSSRADPHRFEIIEFLQPFIDGKVSHNCDLVRQEKVNYAYDRPAFAKRHAGHTWCHDNNFRCECPCHWTSDEIALKLIWYLGEYPEPEPIVGTWLGAYMGRQLAEAKRLDSLAHGRREMVRRVTEALTA